MNYKNDASEAYEELVNLINAAKWHKTICRDSECNVAMYLLGLTAKRLVKHCWLSERERARRLIKETEWT